LVKKGIRKNRIIKMKFKEFRVDEDYSLSAFLITYGRSTKKK